MGGTNSVTWIAQFRVDRNFEGRYLRTYRMLKRMTQATTLDRDIDLTRVVGLFLTMGFLLATALLAFGRPLAALALLAAPAVLYLYASPRACFYIFLISIGFYLPYFIGKFALWPFDVAMAMLFSAMVIDFLLHQQTEIRRTEYDLPFFLLIGATWLSALFAFERERRNSTSRAFSSWSVK